MSQGGDGRDHHIKGFCLMMAGGGSRPVWPDGATDELGYAAVENPVTVHDFHATLLHLLGIDHQRLTVKFQGLDARLTGVSGESCERSSSRTRKFLASLYDRKSLWPLHKHPQPSFYLFGVFFPLGFVQQFSVTGQAVSGFQGIAN